MILDIPVNAMIKHDIILMNKIIVVIFLEGFIIYSHCFFGPIKKNDELKQTQFPKVYHTANHFCPPNANVNNCDTDEIIIKIPTIKLITKPIILVFKSRSGHNELFDETPVIV